VVTGEARDSQRLLTPGIAQGKVASLFRALESLMNSLRTLCAITALLTLTASPGRPQSSDAPRLYAKLKNYVALTYASAPQTGADYVVFSGAPVALVVTIVNHGDDPVTLVAADHLRQGFMVSAHRQDGASTESAARVDSLEVDGAPLAAERQSVLIRERSSLIAQISVPAVGSLEPGVYSLRVTHRLSCAPRCSVRAWASVVRLELRHPSDKSDTLDVLYRQAATALLEHRQQDMADAIEALLAAYPNSVLAYVMRAKLAEQQEDRAAAFAAYGTALTLIDSGADALYVAALKKHPGADNSIEDIRRSLATQHRRLRQ
jgi:hypothetical protein